MGVRQERISANKCLLHTKWHLGGEGDGTRVWDFVGTIASEILIISGHLAIDIEYQRLWWNIVTVKKKGR